DDGGNGFGLTLLSGGRLVLAATNTYTGTTTVSGGELRITGSVAGDATVDAGVLAVGNDTALGGGTLTMNGGRVDAFGGSRALANTVIMAGDVAISGGDLTF